MKLKKGKHRFLLKRTTEAVAAWREWHKPEYGDFPSDRLITAMNGLEKMFDGNTIDQILEEED